MEVDEAQKKLGIYFAAINLISIGAAVTAAILLGLKESIIVFLTSVILLTGSVQFYGRKKLENSISD